MHTIILLSWINSPSTTSWDKFPDWIMIIIGDSGLCSTDFLSSEHPNAWFLGLYLLFPYRLRKAIWLKQEEINHMQWLEKSKKHRLELANWHCGELSFFNTALALTLITGLDCRIWSPSKVSLMMSTGLLLVLISVISWRSWHGHFIDQFWL